MVFTSFAPSAYWVKIWVWLGHVTKAVFPLRFLQVGWCPKSAVSIKINLATLYKFSQNASIFNKNIFHQPFVVNVQKKEKMAFTFSKTWTHNIFWWTTKKRASHLSGNKWNEQYSNFLHKCEPFLSDTGCPAYRPDWLFLSLLFIAYCRTTPVVFDLFCTTTHYNPTTPI